LTPIKTAVEEQFTKFDKLPSTATDAERLERRETLVRSFPDIECLRNHLAHLSYLAKEDHTSFTWRQDELKAHRERERQFKELLVEFRTAARLEVTDCLVQMIALCVNLQPIKDTSYFLLSAINVTEDKVSDKYSR
jgi:hypothetical protein